MKNYLDLEKSKTNPYMRDVCIETIFKYAKKDKNIYFTTPDMGAPALDKFRKEIPEQFIHSGICEQHMIAMAAGLSLMKKKVFCYAMAPFITSRCYEQIKCSLSAMSQPVTLIGIGVGLGYADAGPTHYTTEDIATMRVFPNIEILTPADEFSTKEMVIETIKKPKLRFLRLDREALPKIYNKTNFNLKKGWSELISSGNKCILTSGYLVHKCLYEIKKQNKKVSLIDLFKINNHNNKELINRLKKFKEIITIEEQCGQGGFGSYILEMINENNLNLKLRKCSLDNRFYFENGGRKYLHNKFGLNINNIIKEI